MTTLYNTVTVPFVTAILAAGYTAAVVPTCIPRGDLPFQLGTGNFKEDARLFYNSLVLSGATANGYVASDRCAVAPFNSSTGYNDTVNYSVDKAHPTDAGNIILVYNERKIILSI